MLLTKRHKPVGWISVVLTGIAGVLMIGSTPSPGSLLDYIATGIAIVWFASVLLAGVTLIALKQQMAGILTLVFFPLGVFVAPHFFGLSGLVASLFNGTRFVFQLLLPLWAGVLLLLKGNDIGKEGAYPL